MLAGLAGLALNSEALAQTKLLITGSTAYRGATHTAIRNIFDTTPTPVSYAYAGTSFTSAGKAIFVGKVAGNDVIIKTSWSGSVGGVQTVSQGLTVDFLTDATTVSPAGTTGAATGGDLQVPDVAMSDTFQAATPFKSPVLTFTTVGVVPFKWVASKDAALSIPLLNNITPQLAQVLFQNGELKLNAFTGVPTDSAYKVYAIGRDPDSGTRLTAFAESGVGVDATVLQYQPTASGGAVSSQVPWPATTVNGIGFSTGNAGYGSGGTLAGVMGNTSLAGIGGVYVTYLSTGDAGTAITAGAKEIAYNGVTYSATALAEGQYTFWSYEHLMYKSSLSGVKLSTATALANQLINTDATVKLSTMHVSRLSDGGNVTP